MVRCLVVSVIIWGRITGLKMVYARTMGGILHGTSLTILVRMVVQPLPKCYNHLTKSQ